MRHRSHADQVQKATPSSTCPGGALLPLLVLSIQLDLLPDLRAPCIQQADHFLPPVLLLGLHVLVQLGRKLRLPLLVMTRMSSPQLRKVPLNYSQLRTGRGIATSVGICFLALDTGECTLSQVPAIVKSADQISDSQTYGKTIHKIAVFDPLEVPTILSQLISDCDA